MLFLSIHYELVDVNGNNYFNTFMVFIVKLAEIRTTARLLEVIYEMFHILNCGYEIK